jgi:hypothetical protein
MAKKTGVPKAAKAAAKHEPEVARANAKAAKAQAKATRKENVAAVAKVVSPKNVKVASTASGVRPEFNPQARIVVLAAGKENPRREGTERWKRYEAILKSKTVGDFLAKFPKWNSTLTRCVIDKLIELR